MSKPVPKQPMTPFEIEAASALAKCRFPCGFDKRFARTMGECAKAGAASCRQLALMWHKLWRYRNQVNSIELCVMACGFKDYDPAKFTVYHSIFPE